MERVTQSAFVGGISNNKLNLTIASVTLCAGAQTAPATIAVESYVKQIGVRLAMNYENLRTVQSEFV